MAFPRDRRTIREEYEERFFNRDSREVTVQRFVNIVERRNIVRPELDYDRRYCDDSWYGGPRNHQDQRGYRDGDGYGYKDENPMYDNFNRNSSPPRKDDSYSYKCSNRDDGYMRRQVEIRNRCRSGPYQGGRGHGFGPPQRPMSDRGSHQPRPLHGYSNRGADHEDYRRGEPFTVTRECSPVRRKSPTPESSDPGPDTSATSHSPNRNKGFTYQQLQQRNKVQTPTDHTPSGSRDQSPHSSGSQKENPPASVTESVEVGEEVGEEEVKEGVEEGVEEGAAAAAGEVVMVPASVEPTPTPEEDFKARRAQAIQSKALEIEKLYRQDCETFGMVVKMLVAKQPKLEELVEAPLKENLLEIKQRCLDDLKLFIKELDQVTQPPETST
ncbi:periphilin-1-like [Lampris incognitus]|uniref:periphilin-1-like n=1 Tax=Lampris incognitus TaxID=2546036 RepID=UPI0024B62BC5|nr:periphilin-1-like [Lampris incognitus]